MISAKALHGMAVDYAKAFTVAVAVEGAISGAITPAWRALAEEMLTEETRDNLLRLGCPSADIDQYLFDVLAIARPLIGKVECQDYLLRAFPELVA